MGRARSDSGWVPGLRSDRGLSLGRRLSSAGRPPDQRGGNTLYRFLFPADALERLLERAMDAGFRRKLASHPCGIGADGDGRVRTDGPVRSYAVSGCAVAREW